MYPITLWKDHAIVPDKTYTMTDNGDGTVTLIPYGTVVQQGTNMSAANFNNIELETFAGDLANRLVLFIVRRDGDRLDVAEARLDKFVDEVTAEEKTVTITNTNAKKYPLPSTQATVSITNTRSYLNYTVEAEVTAFDGNVGEVVISDKQLNGFKVGYTGSAKSATIKLKIRGGIVA